MAPTEGLGRGPAPLRRGLVVLGLVVPMLLGIGFALGALWEIGRQLDSARSAQSDNMTWTVAQLEVDLLNHALAIDRADHATPDARPAALAEARRTFDILYSRAVVLDRRARLRDGPDSQGFEAGLMRRVTGLTATIDQDDADLTRDLPLLRDTIDSLRSPARDFVLNTLQAYLGEGDQRRGELRALLQSFVVVGIVLIVALSSAVWLILIVFRAERRRAIEGERMSSNLRSTIEGSLDAMIVTDADACVVHYNTAAARIFGRERADVAGRPLAELGLVEDLTEARVRALLDSGSPSDLPPRQTLTGLRADGTRFPVEASFARDLDTDGRVMLMAFLRDVSAEREAEAALRRARDEALEGARAKSRFLAVMSHEMRTPLNGSIASLDILQADTALDDRQRRFVDVARRSSEMALEQIDDVLELTRLDAGQADQAPGDFDLGLLLEQIVEQNRPLAAARRNTLTADLTGLGAHARVVGQRRMVGRVAVNLLGNAIKFTEGGSVRLTARLSPVSDGQVLLRVDVADTGPGIAPGQHEAIFQDFRTLDNSDTRHSGGTGLGLGIARRAVQQMGGRIWVDSSEGQGATFGFEVPFTRSTAKPELDLRSPDPEVAATAPQALDVLIAEDSDINRAVLSEMLRILGHRVSEARNGQEAVDLATARPFDVAILDVAMPIMDGTEAARRIRAAGASSGARIVGLTAHAMADELARIASSGLPDVEVKPVTIAKLRRMLAGVRPASQGAAASPPAAVIDPTVLSQLAEVLDVTVLLRVLDGAIREIDGLCHGDVKADPDSLHRGAGAAALVGALGLQKAMAQAEAALRHGTVPDWVTLCGMWQATRPVLVDEHSRLTAVISPAPALPATG